MRVLITSSRNTFALDLVRKLGSVGHTVFASDTYDGAVGSHSRFLAGHLVTPSPRFETDAFIETVSAYVRAHDIDLIIPTFEDVFYLAARVADLPEGVELFAGSFSDLARLHEELLGEVHQDDHEDDDAGEDGDGEDDEAGRAHQSEIPEKHMKAMAMSPVRRKVMPSPRRDSGTLEYLSFSRMAAKATIASQKPTPLPAP